MLALLKNTFQNFKDINGSQQGSSLAYYTVFSLFPMIIIAVSILGIFFGEQAVENQIFVQLKHIIGDDASGQVQEIIKAQHVNHNSTLTLLIGFATLAISATGFLSQLHNSLSAAWQEKPNPQNGIIQFIIAKTKSFALLVFLFAVMFASTAMNTYLIHSFNSVHINKELLLVAEQLISFIILGISFFILFKFLHDTKIKWQHALAGGYFTAFLFLIGKIIIALYIGHSHVGTTYGSASFIVIILMWGYYISQIILLGASFIATLREKHNSLEKN
ncbi:YihY/virulence factor BrkB family protein [Prolixibacteraceae bacterium JC049]|nr:YihY/virulence factor BrkB family protein [Prolixibacteraceae bacterium JC049]